MPMLRTQAVYVASLPGLSPVGQQNPLTPVIGAGAGAGGATVVQLLTRGKEVRIPAETTIDFTLEQPVSVEIMPHTSSRPASADVTSQKAAPVPVVPAVQPAGEPAFVTLNGFRFEIDRCSRRNREDASDILSQLLRDDDRRADRFPGPG
jgi:hypothetical protein